jgi:hypothetical protein
MFRLFSKSWYPYYAPTTITPPASGGSGSGSMGKEEMIEFLGDDDPTTEKIDLDDKSKNKDKNDEGNDDETLPKKEKKDTKTDKEDEDEDKDDEDDEDEEDELKDLEDELEEPDEEKLELVTPVRRKEILKKYPNLFKDFPYLEKAYYREQQFTEVFPTVNEAKEAADKSSTFDKVETDIMKGNTENIMRTIKTDQKAFNRMADNLLPTLAKVDKDVYLHVVGNVVKHTIISMVSEARKSNNEQLQAAAHIINQFVFGSSDFEAPKPLASDSKPEDTSKEDELNARERKFAEQRFTSARTDLNTRVNNSLKATIDSYIDPRQSMSDYVRRNASRECFEKLESVIKQDSRFRILVDKLWERAASQDYNSDSVNAIKSAFLSKAKTVLPSLIKQARNEALKGMGKRVSSSDKEEKETKVYRNKEGSSRSSDKSDHKVKGIPKGMSSLDFLMADD